MTVRKTIRKTAEKTRKTIKITSTVILLVRPSGRPSERLLEDHIIMKTKKGHQEDSKIPSGSGRPSGRLRRTIWKTKTTGSGKLSMNKTVRKTMGKTRKAIM